MPAEAEQAGKRPPPPWTLREAGPADRDGILECRAAAFAGEDLEKGDRDYWRWEFLDNHAGPARIFVAEHNGAIVGHYAVIPQRFLLDGRPLRGSIVVDVMTHPDYRNQGMFTALGRHALAACSSAPGLEFTTGYPIRPEVMPGHLKTGWRPRFKIGTYAAPIAGGALLRARAPRLARIPGLGALLALPFRLWTRLHLLGAGPWSVRRSTHADVPLLDGLWERFRAAAPPRCVVQERTGAYLTWRFDQNPGRAYMYHLALDGAGALAGFLVTRVAPLLGVPTLILVDALALPGAGLALFRLLAADARRRARELGCALMATMVTRPDPLFPDPIRLGLLPTPYRFTFITRELAGGTEIQDDTLRWHLMWADTDDV